jgi:hypothetical protein
MAIKTPTELRATLDMIQARLNVDADMIDSAGWLTIVEHLRAAEHYIMKCYNAAKQCDCTSGERLFKGRHRRECPAAVDKEE